MRIKQFVLACLVVCALAGGLIARSIVDGRDPVYLAQKTPNISGSVSAYAPTSDTSDVGIRSDVDLRPLQVFNDVLKHVRDEYVEPIANSQERDLTYGALRYMLDSLRDPLTRFYEPEQAKIIKDASQGKFYGIGAVITVKQVKQDDIIDEQLVVMTTFPGSPASKAGIHSGDIITQVDGKTVLPYDPFQRFEKLIKAARNGQLSDEEWRKQAKIENERIKNGVSFLTIMDQLSDKSSKEFKITVSRLGVKEPIEFKVAAGETSVEPVSYKIIDSNVGYIRINLVTKAAQSKFSEAIADIKKLGVKGIVIDLRDSPGGDIESAQAIAGELLPRRTLTYLQLPKGKQRTINTAAAPAGSAWTGHITVLVNGATSGVSEVLAAAIRDGAGAKLVGSKTFGGSMQQTFVFLRDGSAVSFTTGKYLTPKGVDYYAKGLTIDVTVGEGNSGNDVQLARAIELLSAGKGKG